MKIVRNDTEYLRFIKSLKTKVTRKYLGFNSARVELFKYIEGWYNRKRIHGSIGYLTPQEMEDPALHPAA
jgi:transposase InsO family protein